MLSLDLAGLIPLVCFFSLEDVLFTNSSPCSLLSLSPFFFSASFSFCIRKQMASMNMSYCISQPEGPQKRAVVAKEMTGNLKERVDNFIG